MNRPSWTPRMGKWWWMPIAVLAATLPAPHPAPAQGVVSQATETQFLDEPKQSPLNGHWYTVGAVSMAWPAAADFAASEVLNNRWRGHLATLTTPEENDWVRQALQGLAPSAWLGGYRTHRLDPPNMYWWITEEAWVYTNWDTNRPSGAGDSGVRFSFGNGRWTDVLNTTTAASLLEFDLPAALVFVPAVNRERMRGYELVSLPRGWDAARTEVESRRFWGASGYLAAITSASEGQWVADRLNFLAYPVAWIGAQRAGTAGDPRNGWRWLDGETWDFQRWLPGEPEDATTPGESALAFHGLDAWGWSDEAATRSLPYVVEYDLPMPTPGQNVALGFDGMRTQAALSGTAGFKLPPQFTVEAWACPQFTGRTMQIVLTNKGRSTVGVRGFTLYLLDDGLGGYTPAFSVAGKGIVVSQRALAYDEWHHLMGVLDDTSLRLYVDGTPAGHLEGCTDAVVDSPDAILVGTEWVDGGHRFRGLLDEIRLWTEIPAETEADIAERFAEYLRPGRPHAGLLAYYPVGMDDLERVEDHAAGAHPLEATGILAPELSLPLAVCGGPSLTPEFYIRATAEIAPASPSAWDDLVCVVSLENLGNHQLDYSYRWYRNGTQLTQPLVANGAILPTTDVRLNKAYVKRGDRFTCQARIFEGSAFRVRTTQEVVVGNATPSAPVVHIVPDDPKPWDGLGMELLQPSVDPDGDSIGYEIKWYRSQDGGATFVYRLELSGVLPLGKWVPPAFLRDADIWRVEAIPFELHTGGKAVSVAAATETRVDGESAWDQVYVGGNAHPTLAIVSPAGSDLVAYPGATIVWQASDPDGDPVSVSLWYRDADGMGTEHLLAADLPPNGSFLWSPPGAAAAVRPSDLYADGLVDLLDVLLLASHWGEYTDGQHYRIVARAFDSRKALERVQSDAAVVVPDAFPMDQSGLMELLDRWHE